MICSVFKQRRRINGVVVEAKYWSGRLRMPWETSVSTIALNTSDKHLALQKLFRLAEEREKEHNGLIAPKPAREAALRPLNDLLSEYLMDLQSRGRRPRTIRKYNVILRKLFGRCQWQNLQCVTGRSFMLWRNQCGLSGETLNDLLACAKKFFESLEYQRMVTENPLKYVKRVDTRGKTQYRRGMTEDEVLRFLNAAPENRRMVYIVALYTGLRRIELNNLKWGDVHLDDPKPFVCAPASITKNRKEARLPLRPEVVEVLRSILPPDAAPFQWVFHGHVPRVKTFRKDLARAGILFIDDSGRRVDFHSFRVTLVDLLRRAGVHPRVIQELLRHSDIRLTMGAYSDVSPLELSDSLAKLPSIVMHVGQHACNG